MTTVYLYGHLGRTFGWRWQLDVANPAEAVRAIMANRPDFAAYLATHSAPGYRIFVGPDPLRTAEGMHYPIGRQAMKIVPVVAGASKSPVIGIIIGVVIIAAAIVTWNPALIGIAGPGLIGGQTALAIGAVGATLAIGGIAQLLSSAPSLGTIQEAEQNTPSFLFNGPVNTTAPGHPVPIGYGRLRVGSAVVSGGIATVSSATSVTAGFGK